jgi:hypothetical protein
VNFTPAAAGVVHSGNMPRCPGRAGTGVGTHDETEFFLHRPASLEVGLAEEGEGRLN